MIYNTQTLSERTWSDELMFIHWFPDFTSQRHTLSRRKLLKNLSDISEFTPAHILLLDNLSRIFSIRYYPEDKELIFDFNNSSIITIKDKTSELKAIIMESINDA